MGTKRGSTSQKKTGQKVLPRKNGSASPLRSKDANARQKLLRAAKRLFARQGLSGTSIRDIANEAKLNSSLISYYFESKEGLYRACLQEIGVSRLALAEEILKTPENATELKLRAKMFIENFLGLYLEDLDAGLVLAREFDRSHSPAEDVFKKNYLRFFEMTAEFIAKAQKKNLIDRKKNPFLMTNLLFGSLTSQMRTDPFMEKTFGQSLKNAKDRQKIVGHIVDLFFR